SSLNTKKRSSRKIGKKSAAALTVPSNGDAGGTTEGASDVKKVEAALRESEERFRLAMNNVAAGVYTLDLQGMVTYVNPAAEVMFGWTMAELLGKKMHDVTHYK